jgi:hypothetical protein
MGRREYNIITPGQKVDRQQAARLNLFIQIILSFKCKRKVA